MLDVGEAIVTSPFIGFPVPVKIFDFNKILKGPEKKKSVPKDEVVVGL